MLPHFLHWAAEHNEPAWRERIDSPLRLLLGD